MTKRRAVQIFIVVGVMVLTGFISIFCMLTAITLFILNIYIRERHMRKRFNPWKDTRRNFDAIVIGERYDLRRLHLNGSKILKETVRGRSLYASFHILRTYFSLLGHNGKVYIVYNDKYLYDFTPIDMSIVEHPVTLSIMGCKYVGIKRKFPLLFLPLHFIRRISGNFIPVKKNIESSLILQIGEFCEARQIQIEFIKV